ncbi:hypothetical protein F5Y16DRAFT_1280 [Xylariaceae sp. FL0255]|nr:hypothetical protein F5Y16DRAFT_1280 [Xylariaceae sp. FL0255]
MSRDWTTNWSPGWGDPKSPKWSDPFDMDSDPTYTPTRASSSCKRKREQSPTTPRKRREQPPDLSESSEIATIKIPSGHTYSVHTHLLTHCSDYFKASLSGGFLEAKTGTVHLEEHATKESMGIFVKWLYAKSLGVEDSWRGMNDCGTQTLIDAWLLGDYLQAPEFVTEVHRALEKNTTDVRPVPFLQCIHNRWHKIHDHNLQRCLIKATSAALFKLSPEARQRAVKELPSGALQEMSLYSFEHPTQFANIAKTKKSPKK